MVKRYDVTGLIEVSKSPLRYRVIQKIKHWIWRFRVRNKPE